MSKAHPSPASTPETDPKYRLVSKSTGTNLYASLCLYFTTVSRAVLPKHQCTGVSWGSWKVHFLTQWVMYVWSIFLYVRVLVAEVHNQV